MSARLAGGWLVVDYAGPDVAPCWIATGVRGPAEWLPAFKARQGGARVLQVRPPAGTGRVRVWVKTGETVTEVGQVAL